MGLFSEKSCPLEDNYLKVYGIPAPQKWKPADCPDCQYQEKNKCQYKKVLAQQEQYHKRGQPVLIKRINMSNPPAHRKRAEADALKKTGLSADEQKEYWVISEQLDTSWESAGIEGRKEVFEHLDQWKVHLEKGLSPSQAYAQVQEWLIQREEFRRRS
jgi:hypothetical protein